MLLVRCFSKHEIEPCGNSRDVRRGFMACSIQNGLEIADVLDILSFQNFIESLGFCLGDILVRGYGNLGGGNGARSDFEIHTSLFAKSSVDSSIVLWRIQSALVGLMYVQMQETLRAKAVVLFRLLRQDGSIV